MNKCNYLLKQLSILQSNYIPHETITCDDSNPPRIDEKIKKLIPHKNRAFSACSRDRNNTDLFNKFR